MGVYHARPEEWPIATPSPGLAAVVDAVLLDAGGTLLAPHPSVGAVYATAAAEHGYEADAEALEAGFRRAWAERAPLRSPAASGHAASDRAEKDWWRATVALNFSYAGLREPDDACFETIYARFADPASWRLFPDAVPAIQALRRVGLRVGIVSNFDSRLERLCDGLGLSGLLAFIVYSAQVGFAKPSRRIFEAAVRAARTRPARCLVVGDSLEEDVAGARAAGCQALLLDRSRRHDGPRVIHSLLDICDARFWALPA